MSFTAPVQPHYNLPDTFADFGPAVASVDVDQWVINTIEYWIDTYMTWLEKGRPQADGTLLTPPLDYKIARPLHYANVIDNDQWPDYALPSILVATARTAVAPTIVDDNKYSVQWLVAVSAIVRGASNEETRSNASLSELALRMALVHHGTLGGYARGTRWTGLSQTRPVNDPSGKGRFLGEGAANFTVTVDGAVQWGAGPKVPDPVAEPTPPADYDAPPLVTEIDFTTDGQTVVITDDDESLERSED